MHLITLWEKAPTPNYATNIDLVYPYSETPYLGQYNLVKLPLSRYSLLDHVDYWGEGKIETDHGISGFSSSYNVNHTYQLVSNGPDRDKKIPNRIPVYSYTHCDTSSYIRDNSVLLVTLMGAPINSSCAEDIARMVNHDLGRVVVYGFDKDSKEISNLINVLKSKSIYLCHGYTLPNELKGISLFDNHTAFLNITLLKDELCRLVNSGMYDDAVKITKQLSNDSNGDVIKDIVTKLLESNSTTDCKLMSFAYKLWNNDAQDIVRNYFPKPFKLIFDQDQVIIVNKGYDQALKLSVHVDTIKGRVVWADKSDKTSKRVSWKIIPVWLNDDVKFKLYNNDCEMFLMVADNVDSMGDRPTWGSKSSSDDTQLYYIEPFIKNCDLGFYLINYKYRQGLKLAVAADNSGDRKLWGHNGDIYNGEERYKWIISAF